MKELIKNTKVVISKNKHDNNISLNEETPDTNNKNTNRRITLI